MLVQTQASGNRQTVTWILALLAGVMIGFALGRPWSNRSAGSAAKPADSTPDKQATGGPATKEPTTTGPATAPAEQSAEQSKVADDGEPGIEDFRKLEITIAPADWQRIVAHREQSLADQIISRNDDAIVPVSVRIGGHATTGTVRLKGDWPDHILSRQWSLRFELEDPLLGMRRFSIQHPATRGLIMEWMVMQTARRVGLLTPRCQYVRASINGQEPGFYYLEEHPSKEMLESQGRRDGPIVKFDESKMWATWRQFMGVGFPPEASRMGTMADAAPVAFTEGRLQRSAALNARLQRALEQLDALRRMAMQDHPDQDRLRQLHRLHRAAGKSVDELFDVKQVGKWLALNTVFHGHHGQGWHQLRFYHNPMTDRLEPMVFDTGADIPPGQAELALHIGLGHALLKSPRVVLAAYEELARMTKPGWLEKSTTDLLPRIEAIRKAFAAQPDPFNGFFKLDASFRMASQFEDKAKAAVKYRNALRNRLSPNAAANFAGIAFETTDASGLQVPVVEVDAWACTKIPIRVQAFVFGNGKQVPAAAVMVGFSDVPDTLDDRRRQPDGGVLLPSNGSPLRFRFPADQRLLGLNQVQAIKRAIRQGASPEFRKPPKIDVIFRPVGAATDRRERLTMRQQPIGSEITAGRPPAPELTAALAQHPFLEFDIDRNRLSVPAGKHRVEGDLLLPENQILHVMPGAELSFAPGAAAVVGALNALGTAKKPIRFGPQDAKESFAGVLSLGTAGANLLQYVEFDRTTGIQRGPWQTTGGVTLTGSRAVLQNCTFRNCLGEDSLNIVGVQTSVSDCTFDGGASDLFDGDFINGTATGCRFLNSASDALDVSGSSLEVSDCHFERIGDKALSIGEGSRVTARDCHVHSAMIAASSKDRSKVRIERLTVDQVERFVGVAYIKKPEFGPASLTIDGLTWKGSGDPALLVQTNCTLEVDGRKIPTADLDVKALYEQKILGK